MAQLFSAFGIGIDIGVSYIKSGIISRTGELLHWEAPVVTPSESTKLIDCVRTIAGKLMQFSNERLSQQVVPIGISSFGIVNSEQAMISAGGPDGYAGTNFADILNDYTNRVYATNDSKAACWAEYQYWKQQRILDYAHITAGTGIGAGLVVKGVLLQGTGFVAGHLGHVCIDKESNRCYCGNVGCLELYAGTNAILENYLDHVQEKIDIDINKLSILEESGDKYAHEAFASVGKNIGVGLTTLVNLFAPQLITLGGGLIDASSTILNIARTFVNSHALIETKIESGRLGNKAGVIGSAILACESGIPTSSN